MAGSKILNKDRLLRKIAAIPDAIKANIGLAMEQSAEEIVELMRSLVAVDSGALKKSIGWTWGDAPKGALKVGSIKGSVGGMDITIYAGNDKAYYARWIEFGTQAHSLAKNASVARGHRQRTGRSHDGTDAQPFFYVSFRAGRKSAKSKIRRAVTKAAKQVAAGG